MLRVIRQLVQSHAVISHEARKRTQDILWPVGEVWGGRGKALSSNRPSQAKALEGRQ